MTQGAWKNKIRKACRDVGTYKKSFDSVINTLAWILQERDKAIEEFDGEIIVEHTNKSGATNMEQNPVLRMINDLNRDALAYWRDLGLTPAGLKRISDAAAKDMKEASALEKALERLSG